MSTTKPNDGHKDVWDRVAIPTEDSALASLAALAADKGLPAETAMAHDNTDSEGDETFSVGLSERFLFKK